MYYNTDCITGAREHLADNSIDLIVTDPPYGISGDTLHKHYNRDESFVLDGYVEVPQSEYPQFTRDWIQEAARVLKPGGSMYIVSGYTNLIHILNALAETKLQEINHLIWKYNFGVYTKKKYISSHYHVLFYQKPGGEATFNTFSRYADAEKPEDGKGSLNYQDREDVWVINKEFKPGKIKNKNELPTQLLTKIIQYSSNEGDMVCDFFLGSFSTAKVAIGLNRRACGFEKSPIAFEYQLKETQVLKSGYLLNELRKPPENQYFKQGKPLEEDEIAKIQAEYLELKKTGLTKKAAIQQIGLSSGRGPWSLAKIIANILENEPTTNTSKVPLDKR
jgi:site-specific DNA-methyltransferase (adenine-specific)